MSRTRQVLLQEKDALRRRCQKLKDEIGVQKTSNIAVEQEAAELAKKV